MEPKRTDAPTLTQEQRQLLSAQSPHLLCQNSDRVVSGVAHTARGGVPAPLLCDAIRAGVSRNEKREHVMHSAIVFDALDLGASYLKPKPSEHPGRVSDLGWIAPDAAG